MGASTYIVGIRDLDKKFKSMLQLRQSCDKVGATYPKELETYFGDHIVLSDEDLPGGMAEVTLSDLKGAIEGDMEYGDGAFIDLTKLPSDIKKIRIYMNG